MFKDAQFSPANFLWKIVSDTSERDLLIQTFHFDGNLCRSETSAYNDQLLQYRRMNINEKGLQNSRYI